MTTAPHRIILLCLALLAALALSGPVSAAAADEPLPWPFCVGCITGS
ncbi:hypothetical protein R8Z50_12885 [Longispora sp. K20-0274]